MGANPYTRAISVPTANGGFCLRTPAGQRLILDQSAKLVQGCTVAVFLDGHFMLVGKIINKPVTYRRLVIGYEDVRGNQGVSRIFGLKDTCTQIWRVVGVYVPDNLVRRA